MRVQIIVGDKFDLPLDELFESSLELSGRDGERSLFLPSLRIGWTADWGISGDHQKVTYRESGKTKRWDVNGSDDHAALIELGLDYTTFNVNDTSMGVYARGGALVWGGDRNTSWQVQGGLSFRF